LSRLLEAGAHLRRIGAHSFEALIEAIGIACDLFSHEECQDYFADVG
jgi:hypothetical protein